jgi:hypothetical protein
MATRRKHSGLAGMYRLASKETAMKIASVFFTVLSLGASTIVSVWLLGSVVVWVADAAGAVGQEVLVQLSQPWLGPKPRAEVRHLEPIPVIAHRSDGLTIAAAKRAR